MPPKKKKTLQQKNTKNSENLESTESLNPSAISQKSIFQECAKEPWFFGYLPGEILMQYLHNTGDFALCYMDQLELIVKGETTKHMVAAIIENNEVRLPHIAKSFQSVPKMVEEMKRRRFKLEKNGERLKLGRPIETPAWVLSKDFVRTVKCIDSETGFHKLYIGKMFGKIGVLVKMTAEDMSKNSIEKTNRALLNECRRLISLRHPNIVLVYGIVCVDLPIQLICEICNGKSLKQFLIHHGSTCCNTERLKFAQQVACAVQYVHNANVVHRQVVADTCLISNYGQIKLSGFGLAATPEELNGTRIDILTQQNIPLRAMPPEALTHKPLFTLSCDVWSFGVFLYEIFSNGEGPWPKLEPKRIATAIRKAQMPGYPPKMPLEVKEFVATKCWIRNPQSRAKMSEIKLFLDELLMKSSDSNPTESKISSLNVLDGVEPLSQRKIEQRFEESIHKFNDLRQTAVWPGRENTAEILIEINSASLKKRGDRNKDIAKMLAKSNSIRSKTQAMTARTTTTTPQREKTDIINEDGQTKSDAHSSKTKRKGAKKPASKRAKSLFKNPAPSEAQTPAKKLPRPAHAHDDIDDDFSGSLKED
ncbi:unnamed protein product [Bursaphelenchus xylophilus]|uniref:(pine wood nematode) hypothetical protein n=1 Tax=Bursaphelenchus xylophilus TaxID=6326 RepID=A0A1I7RXZ6_BURXY|nr:unnamed protein product [Bursaphelenchus xylophilus]CAG9125272.1 unnamed protein product [Bursaphelenchus xylophilus]